ncbi:MAG: hypothetical protein ACRDJN_28305 [Chloroflexota bacterium]
MPLREYTPSELARIAEAHGYTVEPAAKESYKVRGLDLLQPVSIPNPHRGRRLRRDQVRYVLRQLRIDVAP